MPALRADAARSRARILEVAKAHGTRPLRLNDIAREAGVGVGTAYRHFPTVHALLEAITLDTVERLLAVSRSALEQSDPGEAFNRCLAATLDLQLEDDGLQVVLLADEDESAELVAAKSELLTNMSTVLSRAQSAGVVRSELTLAQLMHLICGLEHTIRLGTSTDRPILLEILAAGIRAPSSEVVTRR